MCQMDEISKKILNKMAALCSRREYCEFDIREKLSHTTISTDDTEEIIATLKSLNMINDKRYAKAYANDKFQFNKWGKQKIIAMLRMKNINTDIITEATNQIDKTQHKEQCLALLQNKARSTKAKDISKLKNKLLRYALGRGFDYETSLQAISEITPQSNP